MGTTTDDPVTYRGPGKDEGIDVVVRVFDNIRVLRQSVLRDYLVYRQSASAPEPMSYGFEKQQAVINAAELLGEVEEDLRTLFISPIRRTREPGGTPAPKPGDVPPPAAPATQSGGGGSTNFKCPKCGETITVS
jgi:hypothetical protein